jgi:hypothetical protein
MNCFTTSLRCALAIIAVGFVHRVHAAEELPAARVKAPPHGVVLNVKGAPVPGCRLWLRYEFDKYYSDHRSGTVEETTTDEQGRFKFTKPLRFATLHGSLDGETFTILARKDGVGVAYESIAGVDPDGAPLSLRMEPVHPLGVRVQDASMNPVVGATVWLVATNPGRNGLAFISTPVGWVEAVTDAAGNANLEMTPDSAWAVSAKAAGLGTSDDNRWDHVKQVDDKADTTIPLLITLPKACIVGGVVVDDQGAPAAGIPVHIKRVDNHWRAHRTLLTDAEGRFRIDDLSAYGKTHPGSWHIWATGSEWTSAPLTLELRPGDRRDDLRIEAVRGTVVKGIVRDVASKEPIAGATLHVAHGPKPLANCCFFAWSDAEGRFSVRVPPGKASFYLVDVPVGWCSLENGAGGDVTAETAQPEENVVIETRSELRRMGKVRGLVDPPLAEVSVRATLAPIGPDGRWRHLVGTTRDGSVHGFAPAATTDDKGHFEAAEWPTNCPMFVFARSKDRKMAGWKLIETGDSTMIEEPIRLEETGSVRIKVTDATGKRVAATKLDVFLMKGGKWLSVEREAITDKDGIAVVEGVLPGMSYQIRRSAESSRGAELVLLDEKPANDLTPTVELTLP